MGRGKIKLIALFWSLLLVNLFFILHHAVAQVKKVGSQQGLSNNSVTAIFEDKEGFMWFGTIDGLNKYDGYGFKVFRNITSDTHFKLDNKITAIGGTADGKIIVGTKKGGAIMSFHETTFSIIKYRSALDQKIREVPGQIFGIFRLSNDTQLLMTSNQGVLLLKDGTETALQIAVRDLSDKVSYDDYIQGITKDGNGRVWVFVRGKGMGRFDEGGKRIHIINNKILSARSIQADLRGDIWIGGIKMLSRYNIKTNTYFDLLASFSGHTKNLNITDISLSRSAKFRISTDGLGLFFYSPDTGKYEFVNGLASPAINCSYESRQGLVWVGTVRGGINMLDEKDNSPFQVYTQGDGHHSGELPTNYIQSFCAADDTHIWIGTDGKGASLWDRKKNVFRNFYHQENNPHSISSDYIVNILKDHLGKVWFSTYGGGINLFREQTEDFVQYPCVSLSQKGEASQKGEMGQKGEAGQKGERGQKRETGQKVETSQKGEASQLGKADLKGETSEKAEASNVWALYEDTHQTLWASTLGLSGLFRLNRETDRYELFDASLQDILVMKEDSRGTLWAGSYNGIIKIDRHKKKHKIFNLGVAVRAIENANSEGLWIGTEGEGLLYFDLKQERVIRHYTEADGIPNNTILSVLKLKNNRIWLSTFKGLSEFDVAHGRFKNFFENDGLPDNEFSYNAALKLSDQELLFGGIGGFCVFNPYLLNTHPHQPVLKITNVLINNQPVFNQSDESRLMGSIDQLSLPYDKAVITVEYTALEYRKPQKIMYSYYLEGWEEHWHFVEGYRKATYGKLPPGNYKLRIRCTDTEGNWLANEKSISIRINPPFWLSWWAYTSYAVVLVTGVYAYSQYEKGKQQFRNKLALSGMELQNEKILQEKKNEFFTHISHELRSPLTLIVNPVKDLLEEDGNQLNEDQLAKLDIVYRNSKRLLGLVDKFLLLKRMDNFSDELVLTKGSIRDVCQQVFQYYLLNAQSKGITYTFEADDHADRLSDDYADNFSGDGLNNHTDRADHLSDKRAEDWSDDQTDTLYFDREKIEIVLSNLLSNAFKYIPPGGSIALKIFHVGPKVYVTVTDNGPGVAEEIADTLFQQFVREKDSSHSGFGIGLYLAKSYMELHGGKITYLPNPFGGSIFEITFLTGKAHFSDVLIPEDAENDSGPPDEMNFERLENFGGLENLNQSENLNGLKNLNELKSINELKNSNGKGISNGKGTFNEPENSDGKGVASSNDMFRDIRQQDFSFISANEKPCILIIDDNAEIRAYLRVIFEKDYNVICVNNASEGMLAADQQRPDLILCDVMMKDKTGIDFCKEIKVDASLAHIPVFLLTADPTEKNKMAGLQGGADDYIYKPFDKSVLMVKVENMIRSRVQMKKALFENIVNAGLDKMSKEDALFLKRVENLVLSNQESEQFNVKWLASEIGMSHSSLYKKIKSISGLTINDFVRNVKIKYAAKQLLTTNLSISEAAYASGFSDVKYFRMHFLKVYDLLPSDFVKKYRTRFLDYSHIKGL